MKLTSEDLQRLKEGINALKPNRRLTLREQIGAIYGPLMKAKGRGLTNAQLLDYLREQGIMISAPSLFRVLRQLAEQKAQRGSKRGNHPFRANGKMRAPTSSEITRPVSIGTTESEPVPRASSFRVRRDRDEI
jgi:transposase